MKQNIIFASGSKDMIPPSIEARRFTVVGREPGDCFRDKAYNFLWFSVQGMNGVIHHFRTEEEQEKQALRYKAGKVKHAIMEMNL